MKRKKYVYSKRKLEQLRHADFTWLINTYVRQVGDRKRTICPLHAEDSPSFYIYSDNTFHCFGCGAHGNAIDFVMELLHCSFEEACAELDDIELGGVNDD